MRVSYNGITSVYQTENGGSIPSVRSKENKKKYLTNHIQNGIK